MKGRLIACLTERNLDVTRAEVKYALLEKAKMLNKGIQVEMTASKPQQNNQERWCNDSGKR